MKVLVIISGILLLTGCSTGYKQYGWNGGYKEQQLTDNSYEVVYLGSAAASHDTVNDYWHRRAKELCNDDYEYRITNARANMGYGQYLDVQQPKVKGIVTCQSAVTGQVH